MNVLLLGAGHIGYTIAQLLNNTGDYKVVVADRDRSSLSAIAELGISTLELEAAVPPADAALMKVGQKATLDNARVNPASTVGHHQAWHRPGHLHRASSQRVQAVGLKNNGEPVAMDAVWGAVSEGERLRVVHAVVYDRKIQPEMANTLFESIKP